MDRIFYAKSHSPAADLYLLFVRVATSAAMIFNHGLPKVNRVLEGGELQFSDPIGLGPGVSLVLAAFAEFIGSLFVAIGLTSRWAAIPVIFTMGVVVFVAKAGEPFGQREPALLFLLLFLGVAVLGPGKYSLDRLLSRGK